MDTIKNTLKSATSNEGVAAENKGQFEKGHKVPVSDVETPGKQWKLPGQDPVNDQLPTEDGGYQPYKAAGKLAGKKALITGGDSGIGRAIAILEQWIDVFNTNIRPFFFLSKYVLLQMKRGDAVIACASVNPYVGRPDLLDCTASKGAIVAFARGLSNQQIGNGTRVNAVCPGPIWAPLISATMNEKAQKEFTSPLGRPGQPSEVATCFVFLASQDSSFISGQSLHPNGGTIVGS
ncbi:hypothetical protein B0O99DRAFT_593674 [Bisporella sp. PMI_857]|nr:hypothetical protein B0O99DRAFT_593674 [Bisporella sp. PMI_857]